MKTPFLGSFLAHMIFIAFVIFGLPHWNRVEPLMVTQIPVEMVDISELTQLQKKVVKVTKKQVEVKKPRKSKTRTGEAKQVKADVPKPKEVKKEPVQLALKKKVTKKPPPKKEPPKPVQKVKKKEIKKPDVKKKNDALDALFKDIDRMKESQQTDPNKKTDEKAVVDGTREHVDRMTLSEKDALIYQIQENWHYVPGSFDEVSAFKVMIQLGGEGDVQTVTLLDQNILSQTSGRACFESIKRAIFRSSPLSLPFDKKDSWLDGVRVTVDPQHVQIY